MISISSVSIDPLGTLLIPRPGPGTTAQTGRRRATKTATLDGGVVVNDTGYSDGDRDVTVEVLNATAGQVATAARLVQLYPLVTVAMRDGAFLAIPESFDVRERTLSIRLSLTLRLSE